MILINKKGLSALLMYIDLLLNSMGMFQTTLAAKNKWAFKTHTLNLHSVNFLTNPQELAECSLPDESK